jgi:nicotinamide mononucleotide transporter
MYAQARGWVEFWFAWLAVDLVGVPLNFHSGLPFSGLVYIIYFVLVIAGMYSWWQQTRRAGGERGGPRPSKPVATVEGARA